MPREAPASLVVLASGRGSNLRALWDAMARGRCAMRLRAVLSDRAEAPALRFARQCGVATHVVPRARGEDREDWSARLVEAVATHRPDWVVLAGFMRILPDELVEDFEGRMLNIHPSLLPKYRGLHTFRRVLEAGDPVHGSTVHFVVPELDAGPSIIQYRLLVRADDTEATLKQRVQRGEHLIYPRAIDWFAHGRLKLEDGAAWLDGKRLDTPVIVEENDA